MNDTAPVLTLRPPVDARDFERILDALLRSRLYGNNRHLTVTIEDGCIVVREAGE